MFDVNVKEPKTVHLLHLSSTDVDRGVGLCILFLKNQIPTLINVD